MALTCCCCNHDQYIVVGSHVVSTRTDQLLFEGAPEVSCPLVSCRNCSHVVVHPIPSQKDLPQFYLSLEYWQNQALSNNFTKQSWLENLTYNGGLWERYDRARVQLDSILDHSELSEDAKIIDLGSGLSPFLFHCRQRGFKNLYALEPSEEICRLLDDQGITTYPTLIETFITQKDIPQFDVMVLSHTLEHLIGPDVVLQGLRDLLSNQGVLLIVVPYHDHLRPYTSGLHLHFFNEDSLAHLLTKCGYQTMFIQRDHLNAIDVVLTKTLLLIYEKKYAKKNITMKSFLENQGLQYLHRFFWRPLKRLLRLKTNIFISTENLSALAKR